LFINSLFRKCCPTDNDNESLSANKNDRHTPTMYMISRVFDKDLDYITRHNNRVNSSRNSTISDISLRPYTVTVRNNKNRHDKNTVSIYPPDASELSNRQPSLISNTKSASSSSKQNHNTIPLTVRNKRGKNLVWVHPSPHKELSAQSLIRLHQKYNSES